MSGTGYRSVTLENGIVPGIGRLDPDLEAALNLAVFSADHADRLVSAGEYAPAHRWPGFAAEGVRRIRAETPFRRAWEAVAGELVLASTPDERFGHASAHEAAILLGDHAASIVERVADPLLELLRPLICVPLPQGALDAKRLAVRQADVLAALGRERWPNFDLVIAAAKCEAVVAQDHRHGKSRKPDIVSRGKCCPADLKLRVLAIMESQPESIGWGVRKWAGTLGCPTTLQRSTAWKTVIAAREPNRCERSDRTRPSGVPAGRPQKRANWERS